MKTKGTVRFKVVKPILITKSVEEILGLNAYIAYPKAIINNSKKVNKYLFHLNPSFTLNYHNENELIRL